MNNKIQIGVAVIIIRNDRILLGERIGAHGGGTWALPGGILETGESIEQCAQREVLEETGLELLSIKKYSFTNDIFEDDGKHCVTLYVTACSPEGEAEVREPDQCRQWMWCKFESQPQPLFLPLVNLLKDSTNFKGKDWGHS